MKNRKRAKHTTDRREYKRITTIEQDPYRDECWSTHHRRTLKSKTGSKNLWSWKRKTIYQFEYRAYRTWKHNRKTKWK
jgi:hypothetical protein